MTRPQHTIIFWGAGATASIGMQMTWQQPKLYRDSHPGKKNRKPLTQRIEDALKTKAKEPWTSALHDLLTILGDGGKDRTSEEEAFVAPVTQNHIDIMRRHWQSGASDDELRNRIVDLRTLYDWPALKAVINVCPGVQGEG